MNYRRLGSAGLKVSELSLGSWVTFGSQISEDVAHACMGAAYDAGVNFFDNAEGYARGEAETVMGRVVRKAGWRRSSLVISTKYYWGLDSGPNDRGLSRKRLMEGIDGSLKRLQMEYVDLIFCHRPDSNTPIEETVRAMHDIVTSGRALYWGTSEWSADQVMQAWWIAERYGLHRPQMEQPQYHMLHRDRVERELRRLCREFGLGLTTWSPLASGLLSGKYKREVPIEGTRLAPGQVFRDKFVTDKNWGGVEKLEGFVKARGHSLLELAFSWLAARPAVASIIAGATKPEQIEANVKAADWVLSADDLAEIDTLTKK